LVIGHVHLTRQSTGRQRLFQLKPVCALIGSTLIALLLSGSSRQSATAPQSPDSYASAEMKRLYAEGARWFASADYPRAHEAFLQAAVFAHQAGDESKAAFDWTNAGSCSILTMQLGRALRELDHARQIAGAAHQLRPLIFTLNTLASLYIHMGQFENAIVVAHEALQGPAGHADEDTRARLLCEVASSLAELKRFDEAVPYYLDGINGLLDAGDLNMAASVLGAFGNDSLTEGHVDEAEWALGEGLYLVRIHRLNASANILRGLARVKGLQGDARSAAALFQAALDAPSGPTPGWGIYADRGRFRLGCGDLQGALSDFREARRIAARARLGMVPADQDRIALESGLSDVIQGLVDAGNRIARENGDRVVLRETFDAAEQDRLWSLRALLPRPNDWRTRLPERYWELLREYQTTERTAAARGSAKTDQEIAQLGRQLQQIEANAAGDFQMTEAGESPLDHAEAVLDDDSLLLSFYISKTSSWVWAVDRSGADIFPLPSLASIQSETAEFGRAVREGAPSTKLGVQLYKDLFSCIPARYLRHPNWRLELDGPLYQLPFAALVTGQDARGPVYLVQRAALQSVPGALLLKRDAVPAGGALLGIGDPIYNAADARYRGRLGQKDLTLTRLPGTADELHACARAWNSPNSRLLTGADAEPAAIEAAMARDPAIIHFATHVIAGPGDFRTGLIALSLDSSGAMGLLGPKDILARPVNAKLVVVNGCHSAQGQALPSAGLMGLTRAWIGAGASAVLALQWDVPDTAAESLMIDFYRILRGHPERGASYALRQAQLSALQNQQSPRSWAAYSLLSRIP
jgi:CHAT domain-containing protein